MITVDTAQRYGARTTPGEAEGPYCGCLDHLGALDVEWHDWLLGIEDRGAAGVTELLEVLIAQMENELEPGHPWWVEFGDFVAPHNWRDPAWMYRIGGLIRWIGEQHKVAIRDFERRMAEMAR